MKRLCAIVIMALVALTSCGNSDSSNMRMTYNGCESVEAVDKTYYYAKVETVNFEENELVLSSDDFTISLDGQTYTSTGFVIETRFGINGTTVNGDFDYKNYLGEEDITEALAKFAAITACAIGVILVLVEALTGYLGMKQASGKKTGRLHLFFAWVMAIFVAIDLIFTAKKLKNAD